MSKHKNYAYEMLSNFKYEFTTDQMADDLGISRRTADDRIRKMRENNEIMTPVHSFHVIIPPEYRKAGSISAMDFIDPLLKHLNLTYYVSTLSAAAIHGASHQSPMVTQITIPKDHKEIRCRRNRLQFITRHDMEDMPFVKMTGSRGYYNVASVELTAFEIVGHQRHAGGMNNVTTILIDLAKNLNAFKLTDLAYKHPMSWVQRLGYILDFIGEKELTLGLMTMVRERDCDWVPLTRNSVVPRGSEYNSHWKLIINSRLEPDSYE